jgi:uncharacterized protein with NRDE domain
MCLIALAWRTLPGYRLVVAANRDEFYERPASAARWWQDAPHVMAGRDLRAGGTWMGITDSGRFAALTNVRRASDDDGRDDRPTRGHLVSDFLLSRDSAAEYSHSVAQRAGDYNGFNLLVADGLDSGPADAAQLWWGDADGNRRQVQPGVHTLSNADLDTSWPKTQRLGGAFRRSLSAQRYTHDNEHELVDQLMVALADDTLPDVADLPPIPDGSDITIERRQQLHACFITTDDYGTRARTVVLLGDDGSVLLHEMSTVR